MRDFRKLIVWQKAHHLALDAHQAIAQSRGSGAAATRSQLQRAVASIPANIAEGCGKRSSAEFARYLDIALGSAKETENHLIFARDMGWVSYSAFNDLDAELTEIRRMLFALSRSIRLQAQTPSSSYALLPQTSPLNVLRLLAPSLTPALGLATGCEHGDGSRKT